MRNFILFFLLISASFAGNINIVACGSYSTSGTSNTYYIQNNLVSNGTCLTFQVSASGTKGGSSIIYLQGYNITGNGTGTAISCQPSTGNVNGASCTFRESNNSIITNFERIFFGQSAQYYSTSIQAGILYLQNISSFMNASCGAHPYDNVNAYGKLYVDKNFGVLSNPVSGNCPGVSASAYFQNTTVVNISFNTSITGTLDAYGCNFTNPTFYNYDYFPNTEVGCTYNTWFGKGLASFTMTNNSAIGSPFLTSNKLMSVNGNITGFFLPSVGALTNLTIRGKNLILSDVVYPSANYYMYATSAAYLGNPAASTTNITNVNGKFYYCVGGFCNPITFINQTLFPFFINFPDQVQAVQFTTPYTTLNIWWKQGMVDYLVASTSNNEDQFFSLAPGQVFIFGLNNGSGEVNTTIINTCPLTATTCILVISGNNTYTITPYNNFGDIWADITVSVYPPGGTWFQNDTSLNLTVTSALNDLEYYGMNVYKYFNYTTTTICNVTDNTTSGGMLNCTTSGVGRYTMIPFFKILGRTEYQYAPVTYWQGQGGGLTNISAQLQSGNIIDGWTYTLVLLILSALAVIFISQFTMTGAGLVGAVVFIFGAFLWPSAIVVGGIQLWSVALVTTIMVLFWGARQL